MLKSKCHYVYKTTDVDTGEYYIGMHEGSIYDRYLGSGNWIKQHPRPHRLRKEILATTDSKISLRHLERVYIKFNIENELNKNISRGYLKSDNQYNVKTSEYIDTEYVITELERIRKDFKTSMDEIQRREEDFLTRQNYKRTRIKPSRHLASLLYI